MTRHLKQPVCGFNTIRLATLSILLALSGAYNLKAESIEQVVQDYFNSSSDYISDYSRVLNNNTFDDINQMARNLEKRTGIKLVVVIIDEINGEKNIDSFAERLASKVGTDFNGVLLLVSMRDRVATILPGSSLESTLSSYQCERIINNELVSNFRSGNYNGGIYNTLSQLERTIRDNSTLSDSRRNGYYRNDNDDWGASDSEDSESWWEYLLLGGAVAGGAGIYSLVNKKKDETTNRINSDINTDTSNH